MIPMYPRTKPPAALPSATPLPHFDELPFAETLPPQSDVNLHRMPDGRMVHVMMVGQPQQPPSVIVVGKTDWAGLTNFIKLIATILFWVAIVVGALLIRAFAVPGHHAASTPSVSSLATEGYAPWHPRGIDQRCLP